MKVTGADLEHGAIGFPAAAMMPLSNFPRLVQSVQRNCHIADSRHAREMTMCNYLLEMREFYRWEHEVPLARALPRQELGSWISEREAQMVLPWKATNSKRDWEIFGVLN